MVFKNDDDDLFKSLKRIVFFFFIQRWLHFSFQSEFFNSLRENNNDNIIQTHTHTHKYEHNVLTLERVFGECSWRK